MSVTHPSCIDPFFFLLFPLSLFSALVLKYVLSDMSIITLAFFLFLFA